MDEEKQNFLERARRICARTESAKREVGRKLKQKGCPEEWVPDILEQLEEEGMIDEERYAEEFTRSKLEKSAWGPIRIQAELQQRGIRKEMAEAAWNGTGKKEHDRILKDLLAKKWREEIRKGKEDAKNRSIAAAERKGHPLGKILEIMEDASGPDSIDGVEP